MRWPILVSSSILLASMLSTPAFAEKRVALVVGNSDYRNVPALDNPVNDARLLANTLSGLGFTLVGGGAQLDLDKVSLDRAVQAFGAQLAGADVGLFYYAGHGIQVRGENYLIPVDANPTKEADVDFQMLDADAVLHQMEAARTRLNLVILDACRNNPFGGCSLVLALGGRMRDASSGLAQMQAPQGTLISFATQPGSVAQDGTGGNSPYAKALALAMRRPGLDIFQTFNQVGLAVERATGGAQQPWVSSSPIDGSFYFVPPPPPGPQTAALPPSDQQPVAIPADQPGRTQRQVLFDEAAVRQLADGQKISLPARFVVDAPSATVPARFVAYLGAWGGDERWGGNGRNAILIVEDIDEAGRASGIFAEGPPTASTASRAPGRYREFAAPVTDDGLSFTTGTLNKTFKFVSGDRMFGTNEGQDGQRHTKNAIMLHRIVSTEQVASILAAGTQPTASLAGLSTNAPVEPRSSAPSAQVQADRLFTEQDMQRVNSIALRDELVAMPRFEIERPDGKLPAALRRFVGIWASDVGFSGANGRQAMLIVTNVEASARATGYFIWGAPTKRSAYKVPAAAVPFDGKITGDRLTFKDQTVDMTATLNSSGISFTQRRKTGDTSYITLKPVWQLLEAERTANR